MHKIRGAQFGVKQGRTGVWPIRVQTNYDRRRISQNTRTSAKHWAVSAYTAMDKKKVAAETAFGVVSHWTGHRDAVTGLSTLERFFDVPLDYTGKRKDTIRIFAREVVSHKRRNESLPYLLYLQGGPGFESPRPFYSSGWLDKACESFKVVLLDQRGTGRSNPISASTLLAVGEPSEQAAYLQYFRADSIVHDAECIRRCLTPGQTWSTIGQSFGGFCSLTYLSSYPQSLKESLIMGGLAPTDVGCTATTVYRALFKRVQVQNEKYYQRFPQDKELVSEVFQYLAKQEKAIITPAGNTLSPRSLQLLGIRFGGAQGFESVHYMFEEAFDSTGALSYQFLRTFDNMLSYDTNILYAILHESIYCQGSPSNWAAQSVREEYEKECNNFDVSSASIANGAPVYFTGEMIFPWMFDEMAQLKPFKEVANLISTYSDWPALYNDQQLQVNQVPVAAAAYYEDMYVDFELSMATAKKVAGMRLYITNEYMHSGIRENGPAIFDKLLNMARNSDLIK